MHTSVPYMKTSLCANVQLNGTNINFNLKSSLMPFFHQAFQMICVGWDSFFRTGLLQPVWVHTHQLANVFSIELRQINEMLQDDDDSLVNNN